MLCNTATSTPLLLSSVGVNVDRYSWGIESRKLVLKLGCSRLQSKGEPGEWSECGRAPPRPLGHAHPPHKDTPGRTAPRRAVAAGATKEPRGREVAGAGGRARAGTRGGGGPRFWGVCACVCVCVCDTRGPGAQGPGGRKRGASAAGPGRGRLAQRPRSLHREAAFLDD